MKTKNNQILNGSGDLPTMKHEGLGLIEEIVQAAGSITALLINVLKKPPSDAWSTYTDYEKKRYVKEALQISTTSVITGQSFSVPNTFRKLISRVELNHNWDKWKRKNSRFLVALYTAEDEVSRYRESGYRSGMEYINPEIISRVLHPSPNKASIFGNSLSIIWLLALGGAAVIGTLLAKK